MSKSNPQVAAALAAPWPTAALSQLHNALISAVDQLGGRVSGHATITLERPPRVEFGDYSTNAAMVATPPEGMTKRDLAVALGEALQIRLGASLEKFEIAGPGFLNLFMSDIWLTTALSQTVEGGEVSADTPERILVEFISSNPTGPLHVGHARNAIYGDSLARMLSAQGHEVQREFYVNDAGSQIEKFGASIRAVARDEEVPDDGYKGDYVAELAEQLALVDVASMGSVELGRAAIEIVIQGMQGSLEKLSVQEFDRWFYETSLHEGDPSAVAHALRLLKDGGHTYEHEGALWLRTTDFGDDKDRVLVRSNGEHTYFASDIAYHQDKRERGFQRQIDVWGADHHGYVPRMKAAYEALGGPPDELELLTMQLVHLMSDGERTQMSKRSGEFVTLDELVEEIGADATRWYLLARSHDTTVDLDLDLARKQSSENDVYYVQYAHARINSILSKAGEKRVKKALTTLGGLEGHEQMHEAERALVKQLLTFPVEFAEAADRRAPHKIASYVLTLAQAFTSFYHHCQVVDIEPEATESFRIALCVASKDTISRCLGLLGVAAPEQMRSD